MAQVDLNKLSTGDRVIGISGIVLFIFSFFDWFEATAKNVPAGLGGSAGGNAWDFTLCWFAVILGLAMVTIVALKLFDVALPDLGSLTWGQVLLGLGALAFLLVLIKTIAGVNVPEGAEDFIDISRKFGLFIGLIATAGLAVGGYLRYQEDGRGATAPPPPGPPTA